MSLSFGKFKFLCDIYAFVTRGRGKKNQLYS